MYDGYTPILDSSGANALKGAIAIEPYAVSTPRKIWWLSEGRICCTAFICTKDTSTESHAAAHVHGNLRQLWIVLWQNLRLYAGQMYRAQSR